MKIAIITSRFNQDITDRLYASALQRLKELKWDVDNEIVTAWAPGAVELPLLAQHFIRKEHCHAVICFGAVIRGETDHYEYVCRQVSDGCQRVALDNGVPVIFGVLTTHNREQALARTGGADGDNGRYCVDAALEMLAILHKKSCVN